MTLPRRLRFLLIPRFDLLRPKSARCEDIKDKLLADSTRLKMPFDMRAV